MMKKEHKILLNFSLYILTFLVIIAIGVTKIFALEYSTSYADTQTYYDNFGSSATLVGSTWNSSLQAYVSNSIGTTANSYGALVVFNSPIAIIANHTYTISFSFLERYNIAVSSKPRVAIGNTIDGTKYNYVNDQYYSTTLVDKVVNSSIIQYVFTASGSANYIAIPWTTTSNTSQTYAFNTIIIEDLGSEGISETTINNSLANQTTTINNYIQNSTNTITSNSDNNRDAIIANQNENNEALIDSQKSCTYTKTNYQDFLNKGYRLVNGNLTADSNYGVSNYIEVNSNSIIKVTSSIGSSSSNIEYYDEFKHFISSKPLSNLSVGTILDNIPSNAYYSRFSIYRTNYPVLEIKTCKDGNQALNDSVNNLNDSINDDDTGSANNDTASFITGFNTNTFGLTSIITAPLNLIQSLTSKTCTPLHLPLPYLNNKYLDLPCMSTIYSQHFGTFFTLYQTITYGIIAYWVCVRIFNHVKDFKNPEHDEIEVVDL